MYLHVSSTCAAHRCDDTRGCVMQFWPPDDEHMCSKHVEAWNKLNCKTKIWSIKLVNYWDKCVDIVYEFPLLQSSSANETFLHKMGSSAKCLVAIYHRNVGLPVTGRIRDLLTYSMVQSPFWEANWFAASQEIPRISRNPKVHYRTHKRPPPVPILGQPNPVHIPTYHHLDIRPNIIHPSTPRSPQWSPSLRFPHQDHIHPPLLTHTRHMPSPSHSYRFYHPHNIGWGVQII